MKTYAESVLSSFDCPQLSDCGCPECNIQIHAVELARRLKKAIELLHHMRDGDPNYGDHTIMHELIDELEAMPGEKETK